MVRSALFIGVILFAAVIFIVFEIENRVDKLRADLNQINKQLLSDKEEVHVLKAEWSYLNKPERLKKISQKHFSAFYTDNQQIRRIEEVPFKTSNMAKEEIFSVKQASR